MVNLTLRVLSRPEFSQLPRIFQTLGLEYDEKVLLSIGNEVLKAVVVQFNADQLLTERPSVSALNETSEEVKNIVYVLNAGEVPSQDVVAEEMQAVSKGLEKVEQELTASENDGVISAGFQKIYVGSS
ncbi:hypothetical protein LOK49_LG15G00618 [Camellia lanceoleosa]|uniref:Uncharacterized protein n=1 Tax=Camellia lanceoleosa TaxID=1840588 RepID=A0ACC0F6T6_9ERIC|nr:hypothetical protein LOK49_LG15G00618 [Camellia lanceoleosa]